MDIFPCAVCGKDIEMQECHRKRIKYTFCSPACQETPFIPKECIECGKVFLSTYHCAHVAKLCSTDCRNARNRTKWAEGQRSVEVDATCKHCGIKFKLRRSLLGKQEYCSQKCSGVAIGKKHKGENGPSWKPKIKVTCDYCGIEFDIQPSRQHKRKYCCQQHRILGILNRLASGQRTNLENEMAQLLERCGIPFAEQVVMFDKFMVDFLLNNHPIVIQCDGLYWHDRPKTKDRDKGQDRYLAKAGYIVLRFSDEQILSHGDMCIKTIKQTIKSGQMPLINW